MLLELVTKSRSVRRFHEDKPVSYDLLRNLINLARFCPSGLNFQPIRFYISCSSEKNVQIFPCLTWPRFGDWTCPTPGQRPPGYIVLLGDFRVRASSFGLDAGIMAQTILLGAAEAGLGGCLMASIDREQLRRNLSIPEEYKVLLVLALGYPAEKIVIDPVGPDGSIQFWRDDQSVQHVPKRSLQDLIFDF
jgi:nitroreductase